MKTIFTGRLILFCMLLTFSTSAGIFAAPPKRDFYQIKVYTIKNKDQEARLDGYLKDAYIPALHRMGVKTIGVFKPTNADTALYGKKVYVLTPMKSLDQLLTLPEKLKKDASYLSSGKDYIDAEYKNPPYTRFETIVLQAFEDAPMITQSKLTVPKSERIYELRSYEGHTEKIHANKVKMFNAGGEVPLFSRLEFNSVFYGEVIAGSTMPNLMYMTTFSDKNSREEHWKAFFASPEWTKLKADPQYQNNVSKNVTTFLYPADYSDL
ncbi:NIPSNAP family protein [Dyadobacter luticola]|uniref:NIPSNAP family containing protein n=1 Tax=Dyadobacter luticola TaxID=1979387 RepID=A0A5R9L482_9BACT|nr:NIPSNAP family protein [Dyadobacter luticola]TLV03187.1 NIPSNAP family containing protein [Dyadobacter luticola]